MPERFQEKKEIIYKILTDAINAHNYKKYANPPLAHFGAKMKCRLFSMQY